MTLTACSSPALSSSSEYSSSESSAVTSTSEISSTSSSSESSSASSITSSSASSSTSSSVSSSSSSSSSSSVIVPPTPSEIFESFHEKLALKNSTLFDENYIEQKLIDGRLLTNHYYGSFASQGDDGYCAYLDQGIYHFNFVENGIEIDRCKTPNKDLDMSFFFYTTYDLLEFKGKWKKTAKDFVYTSTDKDLSVLIAELDGQGILAEGSDTFKNTLTIANDGQSALYETVVSSVDYGEFKMSFTVKDLGTTTYDTLTTYLASAPRLEVTNEFTSEISTALTRMLGGIISAPVGTSYAHDSYVRYDDQIPTVIFYEDFLAGDQVSAYRTYLESIGFRYSSLTTEKEDLKQYGYIRYYYEKVDGLETYYVELYYVPVLQLDEYEKLMYPNGILHLRFIRPVE